MNTDNVIRVLILHIVVTNGYQNYTIQFPDFPRETGK